MMGQQDPNQKKGSVGVAKIYGQEPWHTDGTRSQSRVTLYSSVLKFKWLIEILTHTSLQQQPMNMNIHMSFAIHLQAISYISDKVLSTSVWCWRSGHRSFRLGPMRVHGPDWERVSFFITSIGFRRKLDDSVQRNLDIG